MTDYYYVTNKVDQIYDQIYIYIYGQ